MRKTQNPRNILYLVLSIVIAAGIWYYVDEFNGRVVTQTVSISIRTHWQTMG